MNDTVQHYACYDNLMKFFRLGRYATLTNYVSSNNLFRQYLYSTYTARVIEHSASLIRKTWDVKVKV